MGNERSNSPAFANPLITTGLNANVRDTNSRGSEQAPTPLFNNSNSLYATQRHHPFPNLFKAGPQLLSAKKVQNH